MKKHFYQHDILVSLIGQQNIRIFRAGRLALGETAEKRAKMLCQDLPGSILCTVNIDEKLNTTSYTPYGVDHSDAPEKNKHLAFNGELKQSISQIYMLGNGHRAVSPSLMRFTSADRHSPFGLGGLNAYAFCNGDPINHIDPSGQTGVPTLLSLAWKRLKQLPNATPSYYIGSTFSPTTGHDMVRAANGMLTVALAKPHIKPTGKLFPAEFEAYVTQHNIPPEIRDHISASRAMLAIEYSADWHGSYGTHQGIFGLRNTWSVRGTTRAHSSLVMGLELCNTPGRPDIQPRRGHTEQSKAAILSLWGQTALPLPSPPPDFNREFFFPGEVYATRTYPYYTESIYGPHIRRERAKFKMR